jgi:2-dehydropantoate 2-reductase
MSSTRTVAILGAGGLGAAYASQFYTMDPASVAFIAADQRYERLKREGVMVNDMHYAIPVLGPDDPAPPADLIIVALKHHQLTGALPLLSRHVGDDTTILSVMNGLDSETMIGAMYGMQRVVYAIAIGIDAQRTRQ